MKSLIITEVLIVDTEKYIARLYDLKKNNIYI